MQKRYKKEMKRFALALFLIAYPALANAQALTQTNSVQYSEKTGVSQTVRTATGESVDVNVQDQTTEIVDIYMCSNQATTTLAAPAALEARTLTLTDDTSFDVGDCIDIAENGHMMQALITATATATNQVTINVPTDRAFTTAAVVKAGSFEQAVDGSVTPIIFEYCPPAGTKVDIVRIMMACVDDTNMDDAKWCGINALSNGWLLRKKDGIFHNIMVSNNNKGLKERGYDLQYSDKAPAGLYGMSWRRTFGGQEKNGVVVRLDGDQGECFQAIVQDNLTGITSQASLVQGHRVVD